YSARITVKNAAISKLARADAAGIIDAKIDARGRGTGLSETTATIELQGRGVVARRYDLGGVNLAARLSQGSAHADAAVSGPVGKLTLSGDASVGAAVPRYHITVAGANLDLARVGANRSSDLNLNATIDGQGIKLAAMDARLRGTVERSRVATLTLTRGSFDLRIAQNRADIRQINMTAVGAALDARGYVGLADRAPLRIAYRIRARDIGPALKLAGQTGGGAIDVNGVASGSIAALKTQGSATLDSAAVAGYSVHHGDVRYDLAATGPGAPYGDGVIALSGVKAGVELRALTTSIRAQQGEPHTFTVSVQAQDRSGRRDSAAASFAVRPNLVTGRLTQLALQLPGSDWKLAAPVEFKRDPRAVTLSRMELRSEEREILAQGTLAQAGSQNFEIIVSRLDFASLRPLAPQLNGVAGTFSVRLSVAGTAAAPDLYLALGARRMRAQSQPIGDLSAVVKYQPERAAIDAVLRQAGGNALTVSGTIPMALQWANGFTANLREGIEIHVVSQRLNLAQVAALMPAQVRDFEGVASVNLMLRGSLSHPAPDGKLRIAGVKGKIVPLGVEISEMHAAIGVNPREISINTLEVHSGDGEIQGTGAIGLSEYEPGPVALRLNFNQWPAIDTQQYRATIGGDIETSGSLAQPRVTGAIQVLNATIIPDLAFLGSGEQYAPDNTITVIQPGQETPLPEGATAQRAMPPPLPAPAPPSVSTYNNLALDVTVTIHRNTWIRHQYAVAELEGKLRIEKRPQGPVRIVGAIHTVRGWINYQNRRFNLQTGQ
ncbi:MAG TPA: translocation/assembly module TamB domain-containing protein, partial [Candidatus Binataceae bacterium]|nr:translocation/assembly module TamB domain-containing protein [Candidatus Binataceae bacterium]